MASFYGGPAGNSFELKEIFRSKVDMYNDLQQRWQSPIGVGDFVFISYGLPSDSGDEYNINKNKDLAKYKQTYNSTLWQKIYTENTKDEKDKLTGIEVFYVLGEYGLGYRLITSMTGNTPSFRFDYQIVDAGQPPKIEIDNTDVDFPVITFHVPSGQKIKQLDTEILDANENPEVIYDDATDVNNPTLQFKLPQKQNIKLGIVEIKPAGTQPNVTLDDTTDVNNPTLNFVLPDSQTVSISGETDVLDADKMPSLTVDDTDSTHPELLFHLPRAQVMQEPQAETIAPNASPAVEDVGTVNEPKLKFSLPRAASFMYGKLLGTRTDETYTLDIPELQPGDFYINDTTGFVYKVISKTGDTSTLEYVACLQAQLPTLQTDTKSPYLQNESGEWEQTEPSIEGSYIDTDNETGWLWKLILPQLPNFEIQSNFIGSTEIGSSDIAIQSANLLRLVFNVPRGSKIFTGSAITQTDLTVNIAEALLGDYYLNTNTNDLINCGNMYQLIAANTWQLEGNIRGPVGERLSTVASYNISNQAGEGIDQVAAADTLTLVAPIVETLYGGVPNEHELIAVNYIYQGDITSYWYFYVNSAWDRVKLTGGIGQILKNSYISPTDTSVNPAEVVYTVDYINKLIVAEPSNTDKDIKTYNATKIDSLIQDINDGLEEAIKTWGNFVDLIPTN